jgi:hypothetical protein
MAGPIPDPLASVSCCANAQIVNPVELTNHISSYSPILSDIRRLRVVSHEFAASSVLETTGVAAMENRIEAIVHAFGEEMEKIVFNSNGKAKTMDLAKAWLRARLEELVLEMRAEFQGYEPTKSEKEGLSQSDNALGSSS